MRAKDIHMAATVDNIERTIYLTGAIDQNDTRICMEIDLPDTGKWRLIKSETNLTDRAWDRWLITLAEGVRVSDDHAAALFSRQFQRSGSYPEHNAFWFFDGEVRPGEPVIKVMDFYTEVPRLYLSHNREGTDPTGIKKTIRNSLDASRFDDPIYCRERFERQLEIASSLPVVHVRASVSMLNRGLPAAGWRRGPLVEDRPYMQ